MKVGSLKYKRFYTRLTTPMIVLLIMGLYNSCDKSSQLTNSTNPATGQSGRELTESLMNQGADSSTDFSVSTPIQAASKAKYLLHGGSLSNQEVEALVAVSSDSQRFEQELEQMVADWSRDKSKLQKFLTMALQQDLSEVEREGEQTLGDSIIGDPANARAMKQNLEEMMPRTALFLMDVEKKGFNEIAFTNKWMVTTGTLILMAWMDNQRMLPDETRQQARVRFRRFINSQLIASDFSDWRVIEFT